MGILVTCSTESRSLSDWPEEVPYLKYGTCNCTLMLFPSN